MFNYSCDPTALYDIIGDVMVVRARVDISAGAEIFLPYVGAPSDVLVEDSVNRILSKHFPTAPGCQCVVCKANRLDGPARLDRRCGLMEKEYVKVKNDFTSHITSSACPPVSLVRRAKHLVADLEKTYLPSRATNIRLALSQAEHWLAEILSACEQFQEATKHTLYALQAVGLVVVPSPLSGSASAPTVQAAPFAPGPSAVNSLLVNGGRSLLLGKPDAAKMWVRLARETEAIVSGGSKQLFEQKFRKVMQTAGVYHVFSSMV